MPPKSSCRHLSSLLNLSKRSTAQQRISLSNRQNGHTTPLLDSTAPSHPNILSQVCSPSGPKHWTPSVGACRHHCRGEQCWVMCVTPCWVSPCPTAPSTDTLLTEENLTAQQQLLPSLALLFPSQSLSLFGAFLSGLSDPLVFPVT